MVGLLSCQAPSQAVAFFSQVGYPPFKNLRPLPSTIYWAGLHASGAARARARRRLA